MQHDPKDDSSDSMLARFLTAKSESISDELLRAIIDEHADPIIKKILRSKLRVSLNGRGTQQNQDALELAGDLRASIIATLRALRQNPNQTAIANFSDYVAIKTYSACADYFREKHPQRWRLKSLLRRRLTQNPRFALWQAEDKRWYASFSRHEVTRSAAEEPDASESVTHPTDGKLSAAQMKSDVQIGGGLIAINQHIGEAIDLDPKPDLFVSGIALDRIALWEQATLRNREFKARNSTRFTPFAHVLGGIAHTSATLTTPGPTFNLLLKRSDNSFAMGLGGGLDIRASKRVSFRAMMDYNPVFVNDSATGTRDFVRFSLGVLFH